MCSKAVPNRDMAATYLFPSAERPITPTRVRLEFESEMVFMLALYKIRLATALMVASFVLCGWSQPSKPVGAASLVTAMYLSSAAEAGPVTAKTAFWEMYKSAYKWAPDIVTLHLAAKDLSGIKNDGGKAALWEVTFGSPSQHAYRILTYATAAHPPDIYKGVNIGRAIPWSGVTRDVMSIQTSDFKVDSDAAYATAAADAAAWVKKNPDKALSSFELGNSYRFPSPVWYVMWGDKKSGYVVLVSAATGKVLKK